MPMRYLCVTALAERRRFCGEAFEPNNALTRKLRHAANHLQTRGHAPYIRVHNGTALSLQNGTADFGLDLQHTTGSSLILHKKTMDERGRVGRGVSVGMNTVKVQTVNVVEYLRSLPARHIALKIDVEGSEYHLLRDLMLSGVLCERVDSLWVEWHGGGRINHRALGLPQREEDLTRTYRAPYLRRIQRFIIVLYCSLVCYYR